MNSHAPTPTLQPLTPANAPAVLAFEQENRAHFAATVGDRGDDYFARFTQHHQDRLAEQASGAGRYYVILDEAGQLVGRINLIIDGADVAELGYRIGKQHSGRGLATGAVRAVCQIARDDLGLRAVEAAAADDNLASQRVLIKADFTPIGPADPADVGGSPGQRYRLTLQGRSAR